MGKVILKGFVIVPDIDLESVMCELPTHIENTRSEDGCLVFAVSQDSLSKNKVNVYEKFVNELAFKAHQERVSNSECGAVAKNCERHYEISGL
jgi:quinol monooxygenase YgiN